MSALPLAGNAAPYLAAILAALDSGVVLSDAHERVIHVSARVAALLGPVPLAAVGPRRGDVLRACAEHVHDPVAFLSAAGLAGAVVVPAVLTLDVEVGAAPSRRTVRWTSTRIALPDGDGRLDLFIDVTGQR